MRRVLRPTGTLGSRWDNVVDDAWHWERELIRRVRRGAARAAPDGGQLFRRFADAPASSTRPSVDAGFQEVKVEPIHADLAYPSAEDWWEWTWSGGCRAFLEALSEAAQERYRDAASTACATERAPGTRRFVALLARARM